MNFRELRGACDNLSPTVLNSRLKDLNQAGIIQLEQGRGYGLTIEGVSLLELLAPLNQWSKQWIARLSEDKITIS